MKRYFACCLAAFLFCLCCTSARAASVSLVKTQEYPQLQALGRLDESAIRLTFGAQTVIVHNQPLQLPQGQTIAQDVPLSRLFLVRDRRPVAERSGYEPLYSHAGFTLAVVGDPGIFAGQRRVVLWPVTQSHIVTRIPPLARQEANPSVVRLLSMLDPARYSEYLSALAVDQLTRFACSPGELAAREKIRTHFKALGLETSTMRFANECDTTCRQVPGINVIGIKRGTVRPNQYYMVGTHYDSISPFPCRKAPGANDNASGVAGVMELARIFSQVETEASLLFVAFSGEEYDLLGSRRFVRWLVENGLQTRLKAFLVLDMISWYGSNYGMLLEGSDATPRQRGVLDRFIQLHGTYAPELTLEVNTKNYWGSDHEPLLDHKLAGALMIETDWADYEWYHTRRDTIEYQEIPYAMSLLKLAAAILADAGIKFPASH